MFLFCFSMVKVVWSACQNKSRAEKARITVLEEWFLCLLHDGRFFPCHYSLCHHKWERIKKPPHSKLDYIPVFNFLLGEKLSFSSFVRTTDFSHSFLLHVEHSHFFPDSSQLLTFILSAVYVEAYFSVQFTWVKQKKRRVLLSTLALCRLFFPCLSRADNCLTIAIDSAEGKWS